VFQKYCVKCGMPKRMNVQTDCEFLGYASVVIMSQGLSNLFLYYIIFKGYGLNSVCYGNYKKVFQTFLCSSPCQESMHDFSDSASSKTHFLPNKSSQYCFLMVAMRSSF
jgi:hypothetical protein